MHPDQIRHRCRAATLQVEGLGLLAAFLHHKGTEKAQRWRAVEGVAGQHGQEALAIARFIRNEGFQLFGIFGAAMDAVQVEENIAVEQRLRLGIFDPVGEVFLPHPL